jgi:CelD/BcsL family acetyltransferase involved in cellulose biosynthesis
MRIRTLGDYSELAAISSEWRALHAQASRPFQEYGWHLAWFNTLGKTDGRKPHVLTAWEGERLVGVMPLAWRRYKGARLLEWSGAKVTDYCDTILDARADRRRILDKMWAHLTSIGGFDVLRFGQVRADAQVRVLLDELNLWMETAEEAYSMPVMWADGESWLASQSPKSRARIRRGLRRMDELGMHFRVWKPGEPLQPILEATIRQKQHWVAKRRVKSFISEPEGAEFVRQLAEQMALSGSLHLSYLEANGAVVATHFGFYRAGTFYYYMPTYDDSYAHQRVGTLLLDTLIRWCCDQGAQRFDMLLGAHEYKDAYGVQAAPVQTLVYGRGLLGNAAVTTYRFTRRGGETSERRSFF